MLVISLQSSSVFFLTPPSTLVIYTLSLHDALPICSANLPPQARVLHYVANIAQTGAAVQVEQCSDRKSTRLNSSHLVISYAVFCLKKKKNRKKCTKFT